MAKILVADDERIIRSALKGVLAGAGYSVSVAKDGEEALKAFRTERPDVVLLDVMMPKMDGFDVCRAIRAEDGVTPVLFLTAKDSEADQIRGLGLGADDYVSKDVGEELLLARISRALKRACKQGQGAATISIGDVEVNCETLSVMRGGISIEHLTRTEYNILRLLVNNRGRAFSVSDLITGLRGDGFVCEDTMMYVHISNLRRKLGTAGGEIKRVPSAGYIVE